MILRIGILFLIVLLVPSCKKSNQNCGQTCLVNSVVDNEDNGQSSGETYQYDSNSRLTGISYNYGHTEINYLGNNFNSYDYSNSNTQVRHLSGVLNNEGAVVWAVDSNGTDVDSFIANYNSSNQLISVHRYTSHSGTFDYTLHYTDDNPDTISMYFSGSSILTLSLEYYNDKANSINFNPLYQEFYFYRFSKFMGASPKNLPKSFLYGSLINYSYSIDADCSISTFRETVNTQFVDHVLTTTCN